eukprot:3220680-Pyramimonas_sp.AAC.1
MYTVITTIRRDMILRRMRQSSKRVTLRGTTNHTNGSNTTSSADTLESKINADATTTTATTTTTTTRTTTTTTTTTKTTTTTTATATAT